MIHRKFSLSLSLLLLYPHRDLHDYRQHNDMLQSDLKRKENIIKELQYKLENNEGCEYKIS